MKTTADISIHKIIDGSHDLLCVLNADMQLVNVSTAIANLWGYSKDELIGAHFTNFVLPEDVETTTKFIDGIMAGADSINFNTQHVHKDGSAIPLSWSVTWMPGDELLFCIGRKAASKQDAEILLKETLLSLEKSIERFEYVTEATTDIIWDWDLETNEVYYSRNIEKSFGHKPGVNVGDMRFFAQYVHPEDRERVVLYPEPVKYGSMNYWTEKYRFQKANGEYAFVLDKGVIIRDENGVGIRMLGAMQDITELKNSELQIAKQNAQLVDHASKLNTLNTLKDRLIAILAHDLRGPLSSLRGVFELFQDDNISSSELMEMIPGVVKKLDYTSDFLDTLLFWVNTQMDNFEKTIKDFYVNDVVVKEKQNLDDQAAKKAITIKIDVEEGTIALADPDSVRIVIRNLATNAIKFSNEKGVIEISAKQDGQHVLIKVKDNGIGMSAEQTEKLFKGKVDSMRGTHEELGTGMGLLFCKDLIEKCNGKIWVNSEKGVGTAFSFTIPLGVAGQSV
ncbi:MAG: PAS domain-containing sensor histidine kinase [Mucilaginibacter sp.]